VKRENVQVITPPGYLGDERYDNPEADYTVNSSEVLQGLGNELNAVMAATAIPFARGKTALILSAYVPGEMLDSDKQAELEVKFSLGIDGELYDKAEWKLVRPSNNSADFRFEKVLTLPEKLCSIQLVVIDTKTGRQAYFMQGLEGKHPKGDFVTAPEFYTALNEETGIEVEEKKTAKKLSGDIPETILSVTHSRRLQSLPAGGKVDVVFIHNDLKYQAIGLYFKRGDDEKLSPGEQVTETDLDGGLKLLRYTCSVPDWPDGRVEVSPLLIRDGKGFLLNGVARSIER
jgi:hypothetical protein